jgi:PAS domain S-box-containing protein
MTGATPAHAPARRLPPEPKSAGEARRFVAEALAGIDPSILDTVELLTSELVTNAVLHAGTDLEVRAWAAGGRVHVSVVDGRAGRRLTRRPADPEAATGRGLQLVETLASAYGVDDAETGKTVWFEIWPGVVSAASDWDFPAQRSGTQVPVRLLQVPVGVARAARRHRNALLREARLAIIGERYALDVAPGDLITATAFSEMLDAALDPVLAGSPPGQSVVTSSLSLAEDCPPDAAVLARVLDVLDADAAAGRLLTRPALPEIRLFRRWMLEQIAAQLQGQPPSPWTATDDDSTAPGAGSPGDGAAWIDSSDTACIAADEDNRIIAVNRSAAELLGWAPEELRHRRITTIVPPRRREAHIAGFTNFLLSGQSRIIGTTVLVPALRRDGRTVDVGLHLTVEQSDQGRTVFVARLTPAAGPPRS